MQLKFLLFFAAFIPFFSWSQIDFEPYRAITTGSEPEVVAIADVNNDGLNDVLLGTATRSDTANDFKVFVFIQDTTGALESPIKYPYPGRFNADITSIAVSDVNNDGLNDVVIGFADSVGIFFQNTFGTLNVIQSYYSGMLVDAVKCGDLNNDGLVDIAVAHENEGSLHIFYQAVTGFTDTIYTRTWVGDDEIEIGDVTGDGLNDVVITSGSYYDTLYVYAQNSFGRLDTARVYYTGASSFGNVSGIAIGDLNNDGKSDVVGAMGGNQPTSKIAIWFQEADTLQNPAIRMNTLDIPESIEIDDLNCDGKNDIITVHGGHNRVSITERDSVGSYINVSLFYIPYASHYNKQGLSIGDINNDGRKDIAIADYNHGLILLLNRSFAGNFTDTSFIVRDTFFTRIDTTIGHHWIDSTFLADSFHVVKEETYTNYSFYRLDSIRNDSLTIREGELCAFYQSDTVTRPYHYIAVSTWDTTFLSLTTYDTTWYVTGIDDWILLYHSKLYPNPTDGNFVVEVVGQVNVQNLRLKVFDVLGKEILNEAYVSKMPIDISHFPDGVYVVSLFSDERKVFNKRILKAR